MKIKGSFARSYDRFVKRQTLLPGGLLEMVRSTGAEDILEFGCGTGAVAVGLAIEGFNVTGVDYSAEMLRAARLKAKERRVYMEIVLSDITKVRLKREYDLILCLGNTIPHFTSQNALGQFLGNCRRHLRPGGRVIFQQLNYDRILREKPSTFAIDIDDDQVRFKQYRYRERLIDFVVTVIDGARIPPRPTTSVVRLMPWTMKTLARAMRQFGFHEVRGYGDYMQSGFTRNSKDLILLGKF